MENKEQDSCLRRNYKISGMTCNGCRSHVEKTLNNVKGVKNASVDLEKAEAEIEMETHIELETFQKALQEAGGNYQIHLPGEEENFSKVSNFGKVQKSQISNLKSNIYYCPMHCEG
ncbi:MAG TPA: heavy metal-associated domain-containing protein, partial [Flavobacteriaceae bacterium]|nr:heavy metal-associated domain-containing protein [Flavobacteriaceae bacterium]